MEITFLFERPGITPEIISTAAGVHLATAYRWKNGRRCEWEYITKLYARGYLTDDDLRAAGLAIPRSTTAPEPTAA